MSTDDADEADPAVPVGAPAPAPQAKRRSLRPFIFAGILGTLAVFGLGRLIWTWGEETTDNAAVEGHVVTLAARVAGPIAEVRVTDGQLVKKGDVLALIDDGDYAVREAAAQADLDAATAVRDAASAQMVALTGTTAANLSGASAGVKSAQAGIASAEQVVAQAQGALTAAQARASQASADRLRAEQLVATGGMTRQMADAAVTADDSARAQLVSAQAGLAAAQAGVTGSRERWAQSVASEAQARTGDAQVQAAVAQIKAAEARLRQSEANLQAARLNRGYTAIVAPFDAVVSKRSVEVGQYVAPGTGLIGIVGTEGFWVMANFKETQIADMKPGQRVVVDVDGLGESFEGKLEALAGATGSRFALLPPDNASGNFTKVVQRVPVHVSLPEAAQARVRAGESAVVTVYTR